MAQERKSKDRSASGEKVAASLSTLLAACPAWITYVPLRGETAFRDFLAPPRNAAVHEIAPRTSLDPIEEARKAEVLAAGRPACVLLPGRMFDAFGTRLGQGGGWYDRFLAATPAEWIRVGLCSEERFSSERLLRQPWDEPVDYVCIADKSAVRSVKTNARKAATLPS